MSEHTPTTPTEDKAFRVTLTLRTNRVGDPLIVARDIRDTLEGRVVAVIDSVTAADVTELPGASARPAEATVSESHHNRMTRYDEGIIKAQRRRGDRFRLAWLSARRRAAHPAAEALLIVAAQVEHEMRICADMNGGGAEEEWADLLRDGLAAEVTARTTPASEVAAPQAETHRLTAVGDPAVATYMVTCSCGWADEGYLSQEFALQAGDKHRADRIEADA